MLSVFTLLPARGEPFGDVEDVVFRFLIVISAVLFSSIFLYPKEVEIEGDEIVIRKNLTREIHIKLNEITGLTVVNNKLCKRISIHAVTEGNYKCFFIRLSLIEYADEMIEMIREKSGAKMICYP